MDFNKALQTVNNDFENIIEIMKLRRTPEGIDTVRNLLLTINIIIDYYLNREDDAIKIPVVYFPECEIDTQEIAEEFVCIKMGLYTDRYWKTFICDKLNKQNLFIPSDVKTKKQLLLARDNYKYEKSLSEILSRTKDEVYDYGKTLIYSEYLYKCWTEFKVSNKKYNRKTVNKYWYLSNAISGFSDFIIDKCSLGFVPEDSGTLYNELLESESRNKIENIVLFPMKTADGRYSDYCSDAFQKPYFDDFSEAGCGLRNIFLFCFSRKPYRLRRLLDVKQRMKERLQVFDDDSFEFITFSYSESLILSGKKTVTPLTISLGKEADDIQKDYENLYDDITNGLDRHISRRNEMSLCISDNAKDTYRPSIVEATEADENLISEIFSINTSLWTSQLDMTIQHFVYLENVFIITGNDVSNALKKEFANLLKAKYNACDVQFGTFGHLRGYNNGGTYLNEIKYRKIIVVSFRNDYTESIFHKYPNSFDPFCINPEQQVLVISNYFFLRHYYDWGKYNYGKALKKILKSDFRDSEMTPQLLDNKRPVKKLPEDTREEDMDRNMQRGVPSIIITYSNNIEHTFSKSEWMLYKYGNNMGIAPLSDIIDLYDSYGDLSIQPLSPLVRYIYKNNIDSEKEKDSQSEKMFKEQPSYGLSLDEINSDVQLWKILLMKKIQATSPRKVYDDIMSHFNERYIVSFFSFKRWIDPLYGIPRARKMQKYLVEDYLGIRPPYLNLIRRIKERTKSDTESITINIRHFLSVALLNRNFSNIYNSLNDETLDLLGISEPKDIENIIDDVSEKIVFESVKTIQQ